MPIRRLATFVSAACCVLAAATMPAAASAHGGRGGHGYAREQNRAQQLCAEAGVPLNGWTHSSGHSLSGLSETQVKELKAACETLATAYAAQRKADEAAAKAFEEARKSAFAKLKEACPSLAEHHYPPPGQGELSTACKEALKAYQTAVNEARNTYRKALEEAGKTFDVALSAFETATKPIVEALEAAAKANHRHQGQGPAGTAGPWGSSPGAQAAPGFGPAPGYRGPGRGR